MTISLVPGSKTCRQSDAPMAPMSRANLLAQRRVRGAGPWDDVQVWRVDFPDRWSRLVRGSFASRDAVALFFDVTFQTACNWWDGTICRPSGDKVALLALADPVRFASVMGGAVRQVGRPVARPVLKRVAL